MATFKRDSSSGGFRASRIASFFVAASVWLAWSSAARADTVCEDLAVTPSCYWFSEEVPGCGDENTTCTFSGEVCPPTIVVTVCFDPSNGTGNPQPPPGVSQCAFQLAVCNAQYTTDYSSCQSAMDNACAPGGDWDSLCAQQAQSDCDANAGADISSCINQQIDSCLVNVGPNGPDENCISAVIANCEGGEQVAISNCQTQDMTTCEELGVECEMEAQSTFEGCVSTAQNNQDNCTMNVVNTYPCN